MIDAIKKLRERTNAGIVACKKALKESDGDIDKAIEVLRKQGAALASKKAGREANEGRIESYIHLGGKIGVQVELGGVTPVIAGRDEFTTLAKELAMQIAAASPSCVSREAVPADVLEKERAIYRAQMEHSGKPPAVIDKIVKGKLGSFYQQVVLLDQASIRDPKVSVADVLATANKALGSAVSVTRFARLKVGEAR